MEGAAAWRVNRIWIGCAKRDLGTALLSPDLVEVKAGVSGDRRCAIRDSGG